MACQMNLDLREPKTANDFALYYDLRWRILREPWTDNRETSRDEHEETAIHLMAWAENRVIAVGRLHFNSADEGQVRYMAVENGWRKLRVGTAILTALERRAQEAGASRIVLNARESAVSFYQKHGYVVTGQAETLFESIVHWRMSKSLKPKKEA
jgi:predicted GNAT family N-acyltransferase